MAQSLRPCHPFADETTLREHTDPRSLEWAELGSLITIEDDGSWEPSERARAIIRAMFCTERPQGRGLDS